MSYVAGLVIVVAGLLVSIALHELGHMVPAKLFGVRVSQYMVGFGPTLWSRVRGETEYGVKAIPLGGYVRLTGMYPPADVLDHAPRRGRFADVIDAARQASAEEIRPGEDHRAFYRLSTPKKAIVMAAGTLMNLVIAAVLIAVVLVGIGVPSGKRHHDRRRRGPVRDHRRDGGLRRRRQRDARRAGGPEGRRHDRVLRRPGHPDVGRRAGGDQGRAR